MSRGLGDVVIRAGNPFRAEDVTHKPEHLEWARHAADVVLTYVFVWDTLFPQGGFGSTMVALLMYRLGQIDGQEDIKGLGILMFRSCGQMMGQYGSHGEQLNHTNY